MTFAAGARYVMAQYGFTKRDAEQAATGKTNGSAVSLVFGQPRQKAFAWEIAGHYAWFGPSEDTDAGMTDRISQSNFFLSLEGRFFFLRYPNAHVGPALGISRISQMNSAVGPDEKTSFSPLALVIAFGGGLQIPLSERLDLTGDYTQFALGIALTEFNLGIRYKLY